MAAAHRRLVGRLLLTVMLLCVAGGGIFVYFQSHWSAEELTRQARAAYASGDLPRASHLLQQALDLSPSFQSALLLAAMIATDDNRPEEALDYYRRLPESGEAAVLSAWQTAGEMALKLGRSRDAETFFQKILRHKPDHRLAHRRLSALYVAQGRRWESMPHLFHLIKSERFWLEDLCLLGNQEELYEEDDLLKFFLNSSQDSPVPLIGRARIALLKNETEQAEKLLREVLAQVPESLEAHVNLGKILAESDQDEEFRRWHAALPPEAENHPDLWVVRAVRSQREGNREAAVRCYWEAIRIDPDHLKANYQLGQLLSGLGSSSEAAIFSDRAKRLESLGDMLRPIFFVGPDQQRMLKAAALCEDLGRLWEARAWYAATIVHFPGAREVAERQQRRLDTMLTAETPRTLASANPARQIDLSEYPLPQWRSTSESQEAGPGKRIELTGIHFTDRALEVGINFTYENGSSPEKLGMQIFQSLGGGVAVIDFDGDGWPDLYFTQACKWPPESDPNRPVNRLYRNLGNGRFQDVTEWTGTGDNGYGQGATVGDFNNDGFPDLYVANIGSNRLYHNNGDGTFSDVSESCGLEARQWTTSCLLADLNGDGILDIYDVNYLAGNEPFEKICPSGPEKLPRTCKPTLFDPETDAIWQGLGDGRFEQVTERAGLISGEGRGLGIVAADLDGSGRLSLLIANDMTANFYYENQTSSPGSPPRFEERGVTSGLAFDFDGKPQACMGIAADDADGDERLDLFITNFYHESNTFYRQQPGGFFTDDTRQAELREPSMALLGFGTQFLDAELDGWPDLVVVNGHIDDFTHRDKDSPFQMPPQFFRNLGRGRFTLVPPESLGEYFQHKWLGRALARLDWNRDGREDFAVSHLHTPAALLANDTQEAGQFLAVRLRAVRGSRDAIGTVVRVTAGERTWVKQLTAGDGFQCSNQRQLVFGLGDTTRADRVDIQWPSGNTQTFLNLQVGTEWLFVEGRDQPYSLPAD